MIQLGDDVGCRYFPEKPVHRKYVGSDDHERVVEPVEMPSESISEQPREDGST